MYGYCPLCLGRELHLLGVLGRRYWYRCRDCGWDFSQRLEDNELPEQEDVP